VQQEQVLQVQQEFKDLLEFKAQQELLVLLDQLEQVFLQVHMFAKEN
jgi:hypothetical protein